MALPETDLRRIRTWARDRVPEQRWSELEVEADASTRHVDIVEVRPPWDGEGEHTRFPIAGCDTRRPLASGQGLA